MAFGSHGGEVELSATNALSPEWYVFLRGELKAKVESYVRHSSFPSPSPLLQIVQSSLPLSPLCLRVRRQPTFMPAPPCQYVHVTYTWRGGWIGARAGIALNSCPNLILSYVFSTTFNHKSLYGRDLITNTDALGMYFASMYEMFIFSGKFNSAVTSPS